MVQLKSFKLVEPGRPVPASEDTEQATPTTSTSARSSSIGSASSATIIGGNLTSVRDEFSSSASLSATNQAQANDSDKMNSPKDNEAKTMKKSNVSPSTSEPKLIEERSSSDSSALSSNEEYQSAIHELATDEDDLISRSSNLNDSSIEQAHNKDKRTKEEVEKIPKNKSSTNLEQGKLEDIAKHRAASAAAAASQINQDTAVTRISIEKGSITNLINGEQQTKMNPIVGQHRFTGQQVFVQPQQGAASEDQQAFGSPPCETPKSMLHGYKLSMPRSQTSPCLQLDRVRQASPIVPAQHQMIHHSVSRSSINNSIASASPALKRTAMAAAAAAAGDNVSQFSLNTQKKHANQFEIRWQNVKLFAVGQNKLLPKFVTDSSVYQYFAESDSKTVINAATCYSPPLKHRNIPPTIDEEQEGGIEVRVTPSSMKRDAQSQSQSMINNSMPNNEGRCILNSISGKVLSGQITAILGPSGVGKTTLLNSLTGRNTLDGSGRVSLISAMKRKRMSVVTVPQIDVLPGKLTTWEDLLFTSRLKNPSWKYADHVKNIHRIVKHLHMDKFLHTRIDRLSGGEDRRLSIGRELLASPDIMILDEPTSGLDANTCKKIVTALRDIVEHSDNILDRPMSIIVTIHQPQREVYNLFHRVYVMAVGGRVVYEGPPEMLLPTLIEQSSLARVTPTDQLNENPAIVAIEVASGEYGREIIDELADYHEDQVYEEFSIMGNTFAQQQLQFDGSMPSPMQTPRTPRTPSSNPRKRLNSFGDSSIGRPTPIMAKRQFSANQLDRMSSITSVSFASTYDAELPEVTSKLKVDKRLRRSVVMKFNLLSHTLTLMQRCWLLATRDLFLMSIRILGFLLVAGGIVQIFAGALSPDEHLCPHYESEVDDVIDYIINVKQRLLGLAPMLQQANSTHLFFFHILLCITMVTSALTGLVFPLQMRMFIREYKNGWYSPVSFILSQTLAELPVDIIGPLITLVITYPLCNQPVSEYYWREIGYALILILCSIICKSQAQIIGAFLMDSVENSVFISCVFVTGPALLSGIPIRINQMILPLQWVSYGSFLRYGFESLMTLRYGYGMCPCDPEFINGYPVGATDRAVPPQFNTFAKGLIDINQPINQTNTPPTVSQASNALTNQLIDGTHDNIILSFIRLVTDAGNLMVRNANELGDCNRYRSLYLLIMEIPNDILPKWLTIMILMFIISRILTYFVVKTVIKLRKN